MSRAHPARGGLKAIAAVPGRFSNSPVARAFPWRPFVFKGAIVMNEMSFLADCLATFRALPDGLKLVALLLPPAFVLGLCALALHHRRALRRLSLEALPSVLDDMDRRERLRQRLLAANDAVLLEALDAVRQVDESGTFGPSGKAGITNSNC